MKLTAPTAKPIQLDAIRPNLGVELAYKKKLQALIDEMNRSIVYWVRAAWRKSPPVASMAQDRKRGPLSDLSDTMVRLGRHWQRRFDALAPELAEVFMYGATKHTDAAMMSSLKRAGFAVQFKPTRASMEGFEAILAENVGLIKTISSQHFQTIEGDVWRAVAGGYDVKELTDTLQRRYGVTRTRAAFIASDQTNKAKATIEQVRRLELGITQAVWVHSGAGREPRESHVTAGRDKLLFDLAKGAYIDGKWILPGTEINCRCISRAVVPGFED